MSVDGPIVVVGGGQAGALLAIYLARQGHDVKIYESRPDLRRHDIDAGRSINLALSTRGIVPLIDVGVIDRIDEITIPMRGRMVHVDGDPTPDLHPYGSQPHEVIHSVSRTDLNAILLDAAEATGKVTIEFEARVKTVDFRHDELHFMDGRIEPFGAVFGADGAGSPVRKSMSAMGASNYVTHWLDHDYKELELSANPDGSHRLDPNALHIWPKGQFMLIALANPSGDFTVTLFAPDGIFTGLDSLTSVSSFFETEFPQFTKLVPDVAEQFMEHPTGQLGTLRAEGWHVDSRAVLVGDAAHAIVPFHGQGMNAALESVRVLDRCMRTNPNDWEAAFSKYETTRKPDADAMADMALENYIEMRSGVVDPDYLAKRKLALELEQRHPDRLRPRYGMVMFSTMPYAEAQQRAAAQADIITAALNDASVDVDALVEALPLLPEDDPLARADALSIT